MVGYVYVFPPRFGFMDDEGEVSDVFELIAHPDRLSIVRALIERRRTADDPTLRFSELRDSAGVDDTGRFNYHLDQLRGSFVTQDQDGYRLSAYGHRLTAPMMGGIHDPDRAEEPIGTPGECPACGGSLEIRPDGIVLQVVCANGHVLNSGLLGYPGILDEREPAAANDALALINSQANELAVAGTCPTCHGPIDGAFRRAEEGAPWFFEAPCDTCGNQFAATVGASVATHPDVVSFFAAHDVDVRRSPPWSFPFQHPGAERLVDEDPLRLAVDVEHDGDCLTATLDREATVVSTERSGV